MKTRTQPDLDGGTFTVPDNPPIPAIERRRNALHARQSALITQILSLRWRELRGENWDRQAAAELRRCLNEFERNNLTMKRRKRK